MAVEIASEKAPDLPRLVVALAALPPDLRSVEITGGGGSDGTDHAVVGDHGGCGDEVAKKLLGLFMQNVHLAMSCCQVNSNI